MTIDQIMRALGQIVAYGGGAVAISYLIFQQFGKAWLESIFSERLNELRHEQNKEVARLRIEIDSMLNGRLKLQDKEFEILPRVWELLDKCFLQLSFVTSPFQTYADIDMMNDEQVEDLLNLTKFLESQKKRVRESSSKSEVYIKFLTFERISDAVESSIELGNYVSLNGILMPIELKEKFISISTSLGTIAQSVRVHLREKLPGNIHDHFERVQQLRPLMQEIETLIQNRLASHAKSSNH